MNKKFVVLIAIVLLISAVVYHLLWPLSDKAAASRALDEFSFYCTDLSLDCSVYIGPKLISRSNGVRIYQWIAVKPSSKIKIHVRVPDRRIGDLTFGLLGKDVTLGSIEE